MVQGAGNFLGSKLKRTHHRGRSQCHRQSSLLFVQHQVFNSYSSNCIRASDPESRAKHTQTPKYRCKNSREENLDGKEEEGPGTQQNLSRRFPGMYLFYQYLLYSFAAWVPLEAERNDVTTYLVPWTKARFQVGLCSRPTPITIKWKGAPRTPLPQLNNLFPTSPSNCSALCCLIAPRNLTQHGVGN